MKELTNKMKPTTAITISLGITLSLVLFTGGLVNSNNDNNALAKKDDGGNSGGDSGDKGGDKGGSKDAGDNNKNQESNSHHKPVSVENEPSGGDTKLPSEQGNSKPPEGTQGITNPENQNLNSITES
jgi:hypothetical protein